jgi:hypothetical protein
VADLLKLLEKQGSKLKLEAAKALRKLTGQEFGPFEDSTLEDTEKALEEWKKWWEENKENEKYRFSEYSGDDEDSGIVIQPGATQKQLEELQKKMKELTKKALGEEKKPEEPKEKEEEKPAEPEKKSEPEKKEGEGEKESRDF